MSYFQVSAYQFLIASRNSRNDLKFQIGKVSDTMRDSEILELIWGGDVRSAPQPASRELNRILSALLPVQLISLSVDIGVERFHIVPETRELLPDVSLGDVLAEELALDVPVGALVLLQNAALMDAAISTEDLSYDIGLLLGEVLVNVMRSGVFPISRELDALYVLAASYCRIAHEAWLQDLGLVPAQFCAGLGASLCAFWVGARTTHDPSIDHFLHADFLNCPRLLSYLALLDSNFTRPQRMHSGLILTAEDACNFEEWLGMMRATVLANLDVHAARKTVSPSRRPKSAQASPEN